MTTRHLEGRPPQAASLPRLLAGPGWRTGARIRGAALIEEVRRAGLRGHGGGGFPTWRKMAAVAEGRRAVVVANGTEGEPVSRKDEVLLRRDPDLVIDGALAAAEAVGAREVVLAVARDATAVHRSVAEAAGRRTGEGRVRLSVVQPPARFITGEESALVHWLNGGPATPTATPPRPSERGVDGRPTLVQNVETLAQVALIAQEGADWFRQVGTPEEPGSRLVTVGGAVARPGVLEIATGTPIGDVLALAGGAPEGVGGLLVGGFFGTWLTDRDPLALPFSDAGLRPAGGSVGAGTIWVLPRSGCPFVETASVARYLARQGAGQCGPCVFGLRDLTVAADALAGGRGIDAAVREVGELSGLIAGRGACAHPDGAARLVTSAVRAFPDELALHRRGDCSAFGRPPLLRVPSTVPGWR